MKKPTKAAVVAGTLLAGSGVDWFMGDEPSPIAHPASFNDLGLAVEQAVRQPRRSSSQEMVLPKEPRPTIVSRLSADTDHDGLLGVDEWFAMDNKQRPPVPHHWSLEEKLEWVQRREDEEAVDPYTHYTDEEIV